MGLVDCKFQTSNQDIFSRQELVADTNIEIVMVNFSSTEISDAGFYLIPATSVGDVDYPADFPRETDYQDILTWGSKTINGVTVSGGLKVTYLNEDNVLTTTYFGRERGAHFGNRILIKNLAPEENFSFTLRLETPPGVASRRFFVSLVIA